MWCGAIGWNLCKNKAKKNCVDPKRSKLGNKWLHFGALVLYVGEADVSRLSFINEKNLFFRWLDLCRLQKPLSHFSPVRWQHGESESSWPDVMADASRAVINASSAHSIILIEP
ncbi:hypothetical protein AVEN_235881-1 [Araneus ventricosus]|uniref:Uncharacterized protein n=1 Tax=Araneus ventricosus TaxID=182803 RepID=A0A4Y2R140_ARAVE|nr:hypothetical protein AVEN_235881-1 [Araneus ventricosus]